MGEINERVAIPRDGLLPEISPMGRSREKVQVEDRIKGGIIEKVTLKQGFGGDWSPFLLIRDDHGEPQWIPIGTRLDVWVSPQQYCIRCHTPINSSISTKSSIIDAEEAKMICKPPAQSFCPSCKTLIRTRSVWSEHCNSASDKCATNKQWGAACGKCKRCISCPKNRMCLQPYVVGIFLKPETLSTSTFIAVVPEDRIAIMLNVWDCLGVIILRLKNPLRTLPIVTKWAVDIFRSLNQADPRLATEVKRRIEKEFGAETGADSLSENERFRAENDRLSEALTAGWGLRIHWSGADLQKILEEIHEVPSNSPRPDFFGLEKGMPASIDASLPDHKRAWEEFANPQPFNWNEFYMKLEFDRIDNKRDDSGEDSPDGCDNFSMNFQADSAKENIRKIWEAAENWLKNQEKILNRLGKATFYRNPRWKTKDWKVEEAPLYRFSREAIDPEGPDWIRLSGDITNIHGLSLEFISTDGVIDSSYRFNLETLSGHQIYRHG
jgi:hypothetical protein